MARFRRLGRRQDDPAAHEPDPWLDDPQPDTPGDDRRPGTPRDNARSGTPYDDVRSGTPYDDARSGSTRHDRRSGTSRADRWTGLPPGDRRADDRADEDRAFGEPGRRFGDPDVVDPAFDDEGRTSAPATRAATPALWAPQPWTSDPDERDDGPVTDPFGFPPVPPVVAAAGPPAPAALHAPRDPGPAWAAWVPQARSRTGTSASAGEATRPEADGPPRRSSDESGSARPGARNGSVSGPARDADVGDPEAAARRDWTADAPDPAVVADPVTATGSPTSTDTPTPSNSAAPSSSATAPGSDVPQATDERAGTARPGGTARPNTAGTALPGTAGAAAAGGGSPSTGVAPATPDPAEASALAGAFAADYLSWDEDDPARRGRALADHLPGPATDRALLGWSGTGRQRAEIVLPGAVRPDGDGRLLVDVRVRVTPYRRVSRSEAAPEPDQREALGTPAAAPSVTARGWRGLAARWVRLGVTVVRDADRLVVDVGDETFDDPDVRDDPPASAPAGPGRTQEDPTLDGDDVDHAGGRTVRSGR